MIPALREEFNRKFSIEKYNEVRRRMEAECECTIDFRLAESPIFLPKELAERAGRLAEEMLLAAASPELQRDAGRAIPTEFNVANESAHPNFAAVDFAITGTAESPDLKLIELQGFPSLFYFQALYSQVVRDVYDLPSHLTGLLYERDSYDDYFSVLRQVIVGEERPHQVVLLELDPFQQKTSADFTLTAKALGIEICNIRDLILEEGKLYYTDEGDHVLIRRIYNRAIYDELKAKNIQLPVDLTQPLDVQWAGHPNWYYRISKVLLPELSKRFDAVPNGYLLNALPFDVRSADLEQYVLKPLFSFAGSGVVVGPNIQDIERVPLEQRSDWMLQERVTYADALHTPEGHPVKAELRVLLLWPDGESAPRATHTLVRFTRGKMVGVDFNKGLDWVGSSCALIA
jgi:hypothetical protein